MELNTRAKQILELAKKYSNEVGINTVGSEYLVLAMYETEDSLCHFLLNEYEVTKEEIIEKTKDIFILRKKDGQYNKSLEEILNRANELAYDRIISEEHLFMATLQVKNTIAISILESLGLSIEDLIDDVKEIYDFSSSSSDELPYVKNITKKAKNNELPMFVERSNYLKKLDIILHRRYKSNPILVGNAGVGKTALVEGYAKLLVDRKSDYSILSLNLTAMLAGTRYRGDFEERFDKFMKEIASKPNVIIFIDEIHTIMGAATTDGNLDVSNMLKPHLARDDIRLIGATTLEEYHKTIEKDKALSRRFQPIFVGEPSKEETKKILNGIRYEYEKFHNVSISDEVIDYLLIQADNKISRRYRPDKCIDLLDDALSICSINNILEAKNEHIDLAIENIYGGMNYEYIPKNSCLEKYKWLYKANLLDNKPLIKLCYCGNSDGLSELILDVVGLFNIGYEAVLEIDLSSYKDGVMLSSLIGAPPGYVGYDDEGILSRHLLEYPMSVIAFKGLSKASALVKSFVYNILKRGSFTDQRGRAIDFSSSIVIVDGIENKNEIGFIGNKISNSELFDEVIENVSYIKTFNDKYEKSLKNLAYEVSFDFDINYENKKNVDDYLYKILKNEKPGKFVVHKNEIN